MRKNVLQDVVPNRRSIRDISLPSRRYQNQPQNQPPIQAQNQSQNTARNTDADIAQSNRANMTDTISRPVDRTRPDDSGSGRNIPPEYNFDYDIDRPKKGSKWGIWALILVFVLALVFGMTSFFASATVSVVAKTQTVPLQLDLTALINQPAGQFGYQIVSVSSTQSKQAPAGAEKQTNTKATGTIMVYNKSNTMQNLVATTRFATSAGLVFRAVKAISVPKATTVAGQTVPGSVSVDVVADQSGSNYNIDLSDFTLPGLKGSAQYANVYGRSKTGMSGGFSGMQKSVDAATLAQTTTDLQNSLKTALQSQLTAQIPQDFILYPQSISYSFATVSQSGDSTTSSVTLTLQGSASAIIFDRALLSQEIVSMESSAVDTSQGQVEVKDLDALQFTLKQPATITKDYTGQVSFNLTGDGKMQWLFDPIALKSDLLGLKKSNLNPMLQAKYPTISEARANIFPVWKTSFPSDPKKITIMQVDGF